MPGVVTNGHWWRGHLVSGYVTVSGSADRQACLRSDNKTAFVRALIWALEDAQLFRFGCVSWRVFCVFHFCNIARCKIEGKSNAGAGSESPAVLVLGWRERRERNSATRICWDIFLNVLQCGTKVVSARDGNITSRLWWHERLSGRRFKHLIQLEEACCFAGMVAVVVINFNYRCFCLCRWIHWCFCFCWDKLLWPLWLLVFAIIAATGFVVGIPR